MRTHLLRIAVVALALAAVPASGAAAAEPLRPAGSTGPLGDERLSDEVRLTRWAHVNTRAVVRKRPSRGSRAVARLRYQTEDGYPEVYLALRSRRIRDRVWLEVRLPGRPNGRRGWVPRGALSELRSVTTRLVVERRALRATLFRDGRRIWSSPVGVGKPSTPTPAGRFWVRTRLRSLGAAYGPWAFGTAAYSVLSDWPGGGIIGIHGTDRPDLIPGRVSHGCVRVPNQAISRLARLLPIGTPVRIR